MAYRHEEPDPSRDLISAGVQPTRKWIRQKRRQFWAVAEAQ